MNLRAVGEGDLELLLAHRNNWYTRRWLGYGRLICIDDHYEWYLNKAEDSYWIAEEDGDPVGLARVKRDDVTGFYAVGGDVFGKHRGVGNGHKVFRLAMEKAIEMGARKLFLWVFLENEAAVRIYKKAGFSFDENEPVKVLMRGEKPCYYARMETVVVT